jgi:hypothetical protein
MNFSEYTLVSFGDSFTFGQDVVPKYDRFAKNLEPIQKQYKIDCNNLSYTRWLSDSLGFKDSLNFGTLAASNERSLMHLETFLRNNPKKKVFVLFNFTNASRFLNIFQKVKDFEYICIDMYPNIDPEKNYRGITKRSIKEQYTYWRNSVQDVYTHIRDRRNLYYLLSSYNAPHVSFDLINNTDHHILRDNPIKYIDTYEGAFNEFMHNEEDYIFKEMDFFNSYYQELVDGTPLLCHMGAKRYAGRVNLNDFIQRSEPNKSSHGSHWSAEGHMKASKIIEKFINERYK